MKVSYATSAPDMPHDDRPPETEIQASQRRINAAKAKQDKAITDKAKEKGFGKIVTVHQVAEGVVTLATVTVEDTIK